jgi:two-component system, NtrC family, sensor histidine kinase KinB
LISLNYLSHPKEIKLLKNRMAKNYQNKNEGGLPGLKILYLAIFIAMVVLFAVNYEMNYGWMDGFEKRMEIGMVPEPLASELAEEIGGRLKVFTIGNIGIILFLLGLLLVLKKADKELKSRHKSLNSANEYLEEERKKIGAIIANLVDPVIVLNNKGDLLLFNPPANKIFGITPEDIGTNIISGKQKFTFGAFKSIIKKEYASKVIKEDENKNPLIEELSISLKGDKKDDNPFTSIMSSKYNDSSLFYRVSTTAIYGYDGKKYGQMKICYDLTREKMIDQIKSEFISVIAHQLRTPLSAVKWVFKMLISGDAGELNPEQKKIMEKGFESNERIIKLINDLLEATLIEEGKYGYAFRKGNIRELLKDLVFNTDKKKNIQLVSEISSEIPELNFDKQKLSLALANVINNAFNYCPENGTVFFSADVNKENKLEIIVRDNGVGIPKDDQIRIFSKFFRAKNVIRMQTEGSGLGLYIAKNIIEGHKGSIGFESEEGKGTTFKILLPLN